MEKQTNQSIDMTQPFSGSVFNNPGGPDIDVFVRGGEISLRIHDGFTGGVTVLLDTAIHALVAELGNVLISQRANWYLIRQTGGLFMVYGGPPAFKPLGINCVFVQCSPKQAATLAGMLLEALDVAAAQKQAAT